MFARRSPSTERNSIWTWSRIPRLRDRELDRELVRRGDLRKVEDITPSLQEIVSGDGIKREVLLLKSWRPVFAQSLDGVSDKDLRCRRG